MTRTAPSSTSSVHRDAAEAAHRLDYTEWAFNEQSTLIRNVLIAAVVVTAVFIASDLRFDGQTRALYLLVRLTFVSCFVLALVGLLRGSPAKRVMAWITAGSVGYCTFITVRFLLGHGLSTAPGHLAADCLAILAIYLLHQPLAVRTVVGLTLAFGSAFDYLYHQGLDQAGTILLLLTLAFANIMGFAAARGTDRTLRERYDALREIHMLRSAIPICAWCKSIRDDSGIWERLEIYLEKNADMMLTHGVCPSCVAKLEAEATHP